LRAIILFEAILFEAVESKLIVELFDLLRNDPLRNDALRNRGSSVENNSASVLGREAARGRATTDWYL